jgi:hypothetical protein
VDNWLSLTGSSRMRPETSGAIVTT